MNSTQDQELGKPDRDGVTRWLLTGERGMSSEAMVRHLTDVEFRSNSRNDYPHDLDDFRRCEVALREIDGLRELLPAMAQVSVPWRSLVEHWDEIVRLAEDVRPGYFRRRWEMERGPGMWGTPAHDILRAAIGRDA